VNKINEKSYDLNIDKLIEQAFPITMVLLLYLTTLCSIYLARVIFGGSRINNINHGGLSADNKHTEKPQWNTISSVCSSLQADAID